jgi:hypothetical protein
MVADKPVNVPPVLNIRELTFNAVAAGVQALPVKSSRLNQLPVEIVGIAAPEPISKFGAFDILPPVVPNTNVRVTAASLTNPPPVLVYKKLVALATANTV